MRAGGHGEPRQAHSPHWWALTVTEGAGVDQNPQQLNSLPMTRHTQHSEVPGCKQGVELS